MNKEKINMKDYGIYYFANIIDGLLENTFPYAINLDVIYGQGNIQWYTAPFKKNSNFHEFIYVIVDSVLKENHNEYENFVKHEEIYIEIWFKKYSIDFQSLKNWLAFKEKKLTDIDEKDIDVYLSEIYNNLAYEELVVKISNEVFFLMFSNRKILQRFNELMADFLEMLNSDERDEETKKLVNEKGKLKRKNIPEWVKNAVFYRDRGRCIFCGIDLTNTISRLNQKNFDHIVPLNLFGFNDVTNIQLTCKECNGKKLDNNTSTSLAYEKWYKMD